MPIRPEMRALYPPDWRAISRRLRAAGSCEACGVPDRAVGGRRADGSFAPALARVHGLLPHECRWGVCAGGELLRLVRIVLTVAHLDQDPANNCDQNLAVLCQQCHNRHDAAARAAGRHARARAGRALGDLFAP